MQMKFVISMLSIAAALSGAAQDMRLFLLVGQSNMAGRGKKYQSDNADNPAILKLDKAGSWTNCVEPVHFDKRSAGACLATSFAREYVKDNPGEKVGLIPCAVGGTGIKRWIPGGDLFKKAVERARIAEKAGQIVGILWHQGEHDASKKELADIYESQLTAVVEGFRKELGSQVAFVAGGLGEYLPNHKNKQGKADIPYSKEVTAATKRVMAKLPRCAFASSDGITETIGDTLHFSTPSLREFGRRYYREWNSINHQPRNRAGAVPGRRRGADACGCCGYGSRDAPTALAEGPCPRCRFSSPPLRNGTAGRGRSGSSS